MIDILNKTGLWPILNNCLFVLDKIFMKAVNRYGNYGKKNSPFYRL